MARETAAVRLLAGDKEPARLASTANLALAGLLTVDGVVTVAGDRVLVKNQTDATANGIYTASAGTWKRAPDFASPRTIRKGMMVFIQEGSTLATNTWVCDTDEPNLGTDNISFSVYMTTNIIATAAASAAAAAVSAAAAAASASALLGPTPQGRLTLASGVTVMTSTLNAKTTLFYTPYHGNGLSLYNGTNLVPAAFSELSIATTDTAKNPAAIGASKINDWFVWSDSGTIRLSHGPDWTNDTLRSAGTALVMVNGILLNNVSITNGPIAQRGTYVGTTRSNASSQLDWILGGSASGGTAGFLGVWNTYNRVNAVATVIDNGATYSYLPTTVRQARASAGNQVSFVVGLSEDAVDATYNASLTNTASVGAGGNWGVGYDSITAYTGNRFIGQTAVAAGVKHGGGQPVFVTPAIGLHYIAALENSDGSFGQTWNESSINTLMVKARM